MPLDGKGIMRHNFESARMHTRDAGLDPDNQHSDGNMHELEDHGDGTFSTTRTRRSPSAKGSGCSRIVSTTL